MEESTVHRIPWSRRIGAGLMLPREHGAWAMLLMPFLLGSFAAGWGGWGSFFLLTAILLLFSSSRPLEVALQYWSHSKASNERAGRDELQERGRSALIHLATYLTLGGASGLLLLLLFQRWDLLGLGIVAGAALALQLPLKRRRLDRSWTARLLSIAALSATGPAAYYVASGLLDRHAVAIWLLAFLYSGASVFYVRLVYQPPARLKLDTLGQLRAQAGKQIAAYLVVAALVVGGLTALGWMPVLGILSLLPTGAKAAWVWTRPDYRPTLKQVGLTEIGHSTLFALLALLAITTWG